MRNAEPDTHPDIGAHPDAGAPATPSATPPPIATPVPAALPAPTGLQADCAASGELVITWNTDPIPGIYVPLRLFEVEINGEHVANAEYAPANPPAAYTYNNPTPHHTHEIRIRERSDVVVAGNTEFSAWAETSEYCPRWVPQSVSASCNSHGVVTLEWDHMAGADNYQTIGIIYTGLGGTGSQRRVHAQRQEGQTYGFQVQAHTAGDWGDPSPTASVDCDPLDPDNPGGQPDDPYNPDWESPNGIESSGGVLWVNPPVDRLVASEATMNMGASNCSSTEPKAGGGHTRTCTFVWTEPKNIDLTDELVLDFSHGPTLPHATPPKDQFWHIYKNSDGHADTAEHRHCPTHDVNGDGDTDDAEDNDGTCPGPDTDLPDLPWHPALPDKDDPFWQDGLEEDIVGGYGGLFVTQATALALQRLGFVAAGAIVGGPIGAAVGVLLGIGIARFLAWLEDDQPTVTIAGHAGCLDPPEDIDWQAERWQAVENSFTTTEQAHGYETVYEHIIFSCEKMGEAE